MNTEAARTLIRLALFDLGPATAADVHAEKDRVIARFLEALESHVDDDTDAFTRWLFENFNDIVHRIAKKKRPDGVMDRKIVRHALLNAIFDSYTYIGDCVHVFMHHFQGVLTPQLNHQELAFVRGLYHKQDRLGGLPLILLYNRFDLLNGLNIWADPQGSLEDGVVHRILDFYGAMVARRREGDRHSKQFRLGRATAAKMPKPNSSEAVPDQRTRTPILAALAEFAEHFRELRGACCACGDTGWWRADVALPTTSMVEFTDACEKCDAREVITMPLHQFQEMIARFENGTPSVDLRRAM